MTDFLLGGGAARDIALNLGAPNDLDFLVVSDLPFDQFDSLLQAFGVSPLNTGTYLLKPDLKTAKGVWNRQVCDFKLVNNLMDDLSARDFTMNAMALSCPDDKGDEQLIDPFGGVSDFQNNVLRCVGNAQANILFSPERLVRAARFCQVFQLNLDDDLQACFSDTACLHMLTQVNPDVLLSQLLKWQRDCSPSNIFQFLRNFPDFGFALLQVVGFKWSV